MPALIAISAMVAVALMSILPKDEANRVPFREAQTFMVELRADGFYPKEIIINKGDTITFNTTRTAHFWPASDIHPSHTIYPEFDPKKPIEPNETWSFQFNEVGTWKYHDHLAPLYKGVVTVQESESNKILGTEVNCSGETAQKYRCWEETINSELEANGLDSAFDALARFYSADPSFDCHGFAHELGKSTYFRFAKHEEPALSVKATYCGYGFYHGFMETLLQKTNDPQQARNFCDYADEKLSAQSPDAGGACYHGIGHGAVDGSDPRAWGNAEAMIAPSMKICKTVSADEMQLYRCVTGVFNAIEILSADSKYKLFDLQKDPFSLCHGQPYELREACYTNMLPALMRSHDIPEIAKIIETTIDNDEDYRIRSMVILSIFHEPIRTGLSAGKTDYSDLIALCRSLDSRSRLPCIAGLSRGFMKYGEPQNEHVKALAFCKSPSINENEEETCFENILSILNIFYPEDKAKSICLAAEEKYRRYCRQ